MREIKFLLAWIVVILFCGGCTDEHAHPDIAPLEYQHPNETAIAASNLILLDQKIENGDFGSINSLIILKGSQVVFEKYYGTAGRDSLEELGGATKSVTSALFGALLELDKTINRNSKIIDLLPGYEAFFDDVPQKDQITLENILFNKSGLWWSELNTAWGSEANDAYKMSQSGHWVEYVLSKPMIREPGFEFNYNSGNAVLLAPLIENLSGQNVEALAEKLLFKPLAIKQWRWDMMPESYTNTAWGLHIRPIDLAKIGYLYISKGNLAGKQIISEDWVSSSVKTRAQVSYLYDYGYQWWRFNSYADVIGRLRVNDLLFAWGAGGQFLFIIPSLDAVIVTTGRNFSLDETGAFDMLSDYIFPSLIIVPGS